MSPAEIISEIRKLSHADRREVLRLILEAEENAQGLANGDQRALERLQTLDAVEREDEKVSRNGLSESHCQADAKE